MDSRKLHAITLFPQYFSYDWRFDNKKYMPIMNMAIFGLDFHVPIYNITKAAFFFTFKHLCAFKFI